VSPWLDTDEAPRLRLRHLHVQPAQALRHMDTYTWRNRLGTTLSAGIGLGDADVGNGAGKRGADDDVGHTEAPAKRIPLLKLMQLHGDWLGEQAMLGEVVQFGQGYARAGAEMPAAVYSYLACNYLLYARSRADAAIAYNALLQLRDVYPRPNIIPVEARAAADEAPSDEDDDDAEGMAGYDHEMALDRAGLGLPGMWPATLHAMSWLQLTRAIDGKLRAVPCSWVRGLVLGLTAGGSWHPWQAWWGGPWRRRRGRGCATWGRTCSSSTWSTRSRRMPQGQTTPPCLCAAPSQPMAMADPGPRSRPPRRWRALPSGSGTRACGRVALPRGAARATRATRSWGSSTGCSWSPRAPSCRPGQTRTAPSRRRSAARTASPGPPGTCSSTPARLSMPTTRSREVSGSWCVHFHGV
jgi:hypothetical protein